MNHQPTTIYLIRHAEPVSPSLHSGSDLNRPLSDRGRRQAQWMAKHLNASGATEVLTSPYARCRETAEIIAKALGLQVRPDDTLHIAAVFIPKAGPEPRIYVAHSNNIPVAMAELGLECHACAHASCWTIQLDGQGRAISAKYLKPDA